MSNKLSAIITKLQEIYEEYGDMEVIASTQDGSAYTVFDDSIEFQTCTERVTGKKIRITYIG